MRATCSVHLIVFDLISNVSGHEKQKGVGAVLSSLRCFIFFLDFLIRFGYRQLCVQKLSESSWTKNQTVLIKSHIGLRKMVYCLKYEKKWIYTVLLLTSRFDKGYQSWSATLCNLS
jgi:hypothetical protein